MNTTPSERPDRLIANLEEVSAARRKGHQILTDISGAISAAETAGERASGRLALESSKVDLNRLAGSLHSGVFRLLVLGDMKRGKSTFLNALLGANVLPADVNPCTAIITVLRFGKSEGVRVHFTDGRSPAQLTFTEFKSQYTIDPKEAKRLEEERQQAFPDVGYAEVEYPLEFLRHGVEIVDSPGLNDTEARNQLSLDFVGESHVVLFLLSATQPFTLNESRYLDTYIKGKGLKVFYVINRWDDIRSSLLDPDDELAFQTAASNIRKVFRTNLTEFCRVDGEDLYDQSVFEISALPALRARMKGADYEAAGLGPFVRSLNTFLTKDRASVEFGRARSVIRSVDRRIRQAVEQRIPLLDQPVAELRTKLASVEPEFEKMENLRDRFIDEVQFTRKRLADSLAESFGDHISTLDRTFEGDFIRYQPELKFIDFLKNGKRAEFKANLESAFQRYLAEKLGEWTTRAEGRVRDELRQINSLVSSYSSDYEQVAAAIAYKLIGSETRAKEIAEVDAESPLWQRVLTGAGAFILGDWAGAAMASSGVFNWRRLAHNLLGIIGVAGIFYGVTGALASPFLLILPSLGLGALQAQVARVAALKAMKKALQEQLPKIAAEGRASIRSNLDKYFGDFADQASKRLTQDIDARRSELSNLLRQKELREIDARLEADRLRHFAHDVSSSREQFEALYDELFLRKALS